MSDHTKATWVPYQGERPVAPLPKPRLFMARNVREPNRSNQWACIGDGRFGFGADAVDAYKAWRRQFNDR